MNNTTPTKHNLKAFSEAALYVVATPIGNLEDITLRALNTLKSVDFVACEDTRHTMKLLNHYGIKAKYLVCHEHSTPKEISKIIDILLQGKSIALVSDAGTPLVSDPGYKLISEALENNLRVVPIPGACAGITALSAAGINASEFYFVGFLPSTSKHRKEKLELMSEIPATLVFYESPKRITATLEEIFETLGDRYVVVARELTKLYEEFKRGKVSSLISEFTDAKGEFVVLVEGASEKKLEEAELSEMVKQALKSYTLRDAVDFVSKAAKRPKNEVYKLALKISKK